MKKRAFNTLGTSTICSPLSLSSYATILFRYNKAKMGKDYLGADQRKVKDAPKDKEEKEIKVFKVVFYGYFRVG